MSNTHQELIYFSHEKKNEKQNFSGVFSPFGAEKRKEFLGKYATMLKEYYQCGALPEKVVDDSEVDKLLERYAFFDKSNENVLYINEMDAYTRDSFSPFERWQFYTFGVDVKDNEVWFLDGITPPVPAAKYEFKNEGRLTEFSFSFYVEEFLCEQKAGIVNVRGKFFELRSGIRSVLKLHLLADGQLYYVDGSKGDGTHPDYVHLGNCKEKTWHNVNICFKESSCDISLDKNIVKENLPLYSTYNPDTFFTSGGMHPMGKWAVRLEELKTKEETFTDFFIPQKRKNAEERALGKVTLPFAIGTQDYADKELVFRTKFDCVKTKHAKLTLKSIDPCGFVYLNGRLICKAEDFLCKTLHIENYLQEKDNVLEIVVESRAPEVFYQWHRHSDPYNGWFFRGGMIEFYEDNYVEDICVSTKTINDGSIAFDLKTTLSGKGDARIFIRKIYPFSKLAKQIDAFTYNGNYEFAKTYELPLEVWDCEHPNLYEIIVKVESEENGSFEKSIETGFRIIEQKNGRFYLNGKRILLNGALSMQFLPPYEEIPVNHLCASNAQIVTQIEQVKRMNGNTLRMHFLGYGSNDERYARFADRAGCMLIWTTRLIDGVEGLLMHKEWKMSEAFSEQIKEVRQYPSIIMWEGSNEAKGNLIQIDRMYDSFVSAVRAVDDTRLICPCSHLYYGGGIYGDGGEYEYYQDDGHANQYFDATQSSWGWTDKSVIRSAHTYAILLGYGTDWEAYVRQDWASQNALLQSKNHAYAITEYAVIGRACPYTEEAKTYFNPNSYELGDEIAALGFALEDGEYELSQAHQALCALYANKKMRLLDVDGMLWCCLQGGANDSSYLKPIIDFYGYAKFAFFVLSDCYKNDYCVLDCDGPFWGKGDIIKPVLLAQKGDYKVVIKVVDEKREIVFEKEYKVRANEWQTPLEACNVSFEKDGYYTITTATQKI